MLSRWIAAFVIVFAACVRPLSAAPAEFVERVYAVTINGEAVSSGAVVLEAPDGAILIAGDDLDRWRANLAGKVPRTTRDARPFFSLRDFTAVTTRIDENKQLLEIRAPLDFFVPTVLAGLYENGRRVINRSRGAFLNYDFIADRFENASVEQAIFEGGISALRGGVLMSSVAWRPSTSDAHFVRLNTTWERDYVEARRTFRVGDAVSSPGRLGGSVSLAGLQFASDYATDPEFSTSPGLLVRGFAPTASTVDILVNNVPFVNGQVVPAGPFVLNAPPLGIDGQGQVSVIVRDALGVEHIVVEPFYQGRDLLKAGVNEYSYEAGFQRNNLGSSSFSYGKPIVSATLRRGITDTYSAEGHVEATPNLQLGEFTADFALARVGLVSTGLATSFGSAGVGVRGLLGYQYRSLHGFSIAATFAGASPAFRTIGDDALGGLSGELIVTLPVRTLSVSAGLLEARQLGGKSASFATLGLSGRVAGGNLNLSTTQALSGGVNTYFLGYSTRIGRTSLNNRVTSGLGPQRITSDLVTDLPQSGFGSSVDVSLDREAGNRSSVGLGYVFESPLGHFDAFSDRGSTFANLRGGLTFVDGKLSATREITSSYGMAVVPGYPNVRVYVNGLLVGRTDRNGMVALPFLVPYTVNRVTVEQRDLPIGANFERFFENTVPYLHNATIVRFKTGPAGGVVFHLRFPDNSPVPGGSNVMASAGAASAPVGDDGLTYIPALPVGRSTHSVSISGDGTCTFTIDVPHDTADIPDIGNVVCVGASPPVTAPPAAASPSAAPETPNPSASGAQNQSIPKVAPSGSPLPALTAPPSRGAPSPIPSPTSTL